MRSNPSKNRSTTRQKAAMAMLLIVIASAVAWWWMRPADRLSTDQYAIALALYRVCNQRSDQGLDEIELLWNQSAATEQNARSRRAIDSIIADARSKQWQDALQACRRLLEDQVEPVKL